jgi:hypothetical protein
MAITLLTLLIDASYGRFACCCVARTQETPCLTGTIVLQTSWIATDRGRLWSRRPSIG